MNITPITVVQGVLLFGAFYFVIAGTIILIGG